MNMLGWVNSLNHLLSPSHISLDLPRFVAKFHKLAHERSGGRKVVGTHPYAHPQHIKVDKHFIYIYI